MDSWTQLAARPAPPIQPAGPDEGPMRRPEAHPAESPRSKVLDDATGRPSLSDVKRATTHARPNSPGEISRPSGLESGPHGTADRAVGLDLELRQPAQREIDRRLPPLPDPRRLRPDESSHRDVSRPEPESHWSGAERRPPRDDRTYRQDPLRPSADAFIDRDGYQRDGLSRPDQARDRSIDGRREVPGGSRLPNNDGLRATLEPGRDALVYRDDRRGPDWLRSGFGTEPGSHRDERRGPERRWSRFGPERSALRDNAHRPEGDQGGLALESDSHRHHEPRRTLEPANGDGFELGPDAYRDDGRGAAADWHSPLPSPARLAPARPSVDDRPDPPAAPQPLHADAWPGSSTTPGEQDDDVVTSPLPVILHGATSLPRPEQVNAPRGPFEPARPSQPPIRTASVTGSVEPPPAMLAAPADPPPAAPSTPLSVQRPIPAAAAAKIDQIKDLYLTAEAIGEDALDKHFQQVSQRQRELIREFFERSKPGENASS